MPLFVYRCSSCNHEDELFSGKPRRPFSCLTGSKCRGRMERVPTAAALKFEGPGWARDGYSVTSRHGSTSRAKDGYSSVRKKK